MKIQHLINVKVFELPKNVNSFRKYAFIYLYTYLYIYACMKPSLEYTENYSNIFINFTINQVKGIKIFQTFFFHNTVHTVSESILYIRLAQHYAQITTFFYLYCRNIGFGLIFLIFFFTSLRFILFFSNKLFN